jgi:sulfur-carrier protein
MAELTLRYFASLRDAAGRDDERIPHQSDALKLYRDKAREFGFTLPPERLRLAVNGQFVPWSQPLQAGDDVVFIPPMSGG